MKIQKRTITMVVKFLGIFLFVCLAGQFIALPLGVHMEYNTTQYGAFYIYYAGEEKALSEEQRQDEVVQGQEDGQILQLYLPKDEVFTLRVDLEEGLREIELSKMTVTFLNMPLVTLQNELLFNALVLTDMQAEYSGEGTSLISSGADPSFALTFHTMPRDMRVINLLMNLFVSLLLFVLLKNITVPNRKQVFVGTVASVLILPTVLYTLLGLAPNAELENRTLAKVPTLSLSTLARFPSEYEAYYNDHIPFKDEAISFVSATKYYAFHVSTAPRVILGEEGFLYTTETLEDYERTNLMSEEELAALTQRLQEIEAQLSARGIDLVVSIAPNKNTVYPQYMPRGYLEGEGESRAEQIARHIESQTDVPFVFLQEELEPYAQTTQLYHKGDTHWNARGAYIGYAALANRAGVENVPPFEEMTFSEDALMSMAQRDLVNLLNFDLYTGDMNESALLFPGVETTMLEQEIVGGVSGYLLYESTAQDERKLLMFRDSFGSALMPYFARSFAESAFYWQGYDIAIVEEEEPDVVIIEIAERFAPNLAESLVNQNV